jgi:coenzyme PQQ precursor peptide PqqA
MPAAMTGSDFGSRPGVDTGRRPKLRYTVGVSCGSAASAEENAMAWNTPTLVEICIGLEINGYLPAEF